MCTYSLWGNLGAIKIMGPNYWLWPGLEAEFNSLCYGKIPAP